MNKTIRLIPLAAAALLAAACSDKNQIVINGKIDTDAENVYIIADGDTVATAPVVDGAFSAKVILDGAMGVLYVRDIPGTAFGTVIAEPGTVSYVKEGDETSVTGTRVNDIYQAYRDKMSELFKAYSSAETDEERQAISDEAEEVDDKLYEDNLDNYLSLIMLQQNAYGMEAEELETELARISPKLAATKLMTNLSSRVELLRKTAAGQPYIEINLPDADGKEVPLSSVVGEGKWVLVDFWASWCGPCMGELPYLLKSYADFHGKGFEIYGVSLDRAKEPWIKAIEDNHMDWIHVSDIAYWQCKAAADYGVNAIPANFLISPEGKIVAKNLRGDNLASTLEKFIGE